MFSLNLHPIEWACGAGIVFTLFGLLWLWDWNRQKESEALILNTVPPLPVPDAIVTLLHYPNASIEVKATDAMGHPVAEMVKQYMVDKVIEEAGYKKRTTPAVCEASTVLEPVSVKVEEPLVESPLDVLYPKTPEEAIDGMKARGSKRNANS